MKKKIDQLINIVNVLFYQEKGYKSTLHKIFSCDSQELLNILMRTKSKLFQINVQPKNLSRE